MSEIDLAYDCRSHLVQPVGESIIGAWGGTKDLPIIHDEFVSASSSLPLWQRLEHANDLDGGLEVQRQCIVCLSLKLDIQQGFGRYER